jgi:hypothetical protein
LKTIKRSLQTLMKTKTLMILSATIGGLLASVCPAQAQGTAFTYQGQLLNNGSPVNGTIYLNFALYAFQNGGNPVMGGGPIAAVGGAQVQANNGLISVTLDFGAAPNPFATGQVLWLEIDQSANGNAGTYSIIGSRQAITPTPYAIFSENAAQLGGQSASSYVAKNGDTMTGILNLPPDGLTLADNQLVASGGNIGIGTATPIADLDVEGNDASRSYNYPVVLIQNVNTSSNAAPALRVVDWGNTTYGALSVSANGTGPIAQFGNYSSFVADIQTNGTLDAVNGIFSGNVGIGTTSPTGKLHVYGNSAPGGNIPTSATILASGDGFHNRFMSVNGNQAVYMSAFDASSGEISTYDYGTGQGLRLNLNVNGGTVSVPVLEIRGGSDLAEPFEMSSKDVPMGAVMVIDDSQPGRLKMSTGAYDSRVAGIISGANGINPGISLHQEGALEGGQNVALSGRVYALADASNGPIKPGDLLTTSDTPGHAMKVTDHAKAQGAVIGKAMSSLRQGKGMVLVLVSLQ